MAVMGFTSKKPGTKWHSKKPLKYKSKQTKLEAKKHENLGLILS